MVLASFSLLILVGCANPDARFVRVEGTVTLNGEPVEGAVITFLSTVADGDSAAGNTDANGRFTMTSSSAAGAGTGVLPGEYTVVISKRDVPPDPDGAAYERGDIDYNELQRRRAARGMASAPSVELIPMRYTRPSTTDLRASVQPGRNAPFNFDLTN